MGKFDGKVVLITGGARGQGRSHALKFASEGADVAFCDIAAQIDSVPYPMARSADLDETVKLVEELTGVASGSPPTSGTARRCRRSSTGRSPSSGGSTSCSPTPGSSRSRPSPRWTTASGSR